jgi:hypothetical protein
VSGNLSLVEKKMEDEKKKECRNYDNARHFDIEFELLTDKVKKEQFS